MMEWTRKWHDYINEYYSNPRIIKIIDIEKLTISLQTVGGLIVSDFYEE
ncbi:MAG: hypothetical protein LBG48_02915 [Rickettsiales bacterium]|jgi:hypothetical protein|nr:hypothetical protein [Rickettsiales bacterium]